MNCLLGPDRDALPASEGTLVYFASYPARTVHHSTIKLYLAAVCNPHITAGYNDPLKGKLLLRKVLRGILRYQGQQHLRRQPVTPQVLLTICPVLQSWLSPRDFSMVWADFNLAFFAFLRCSEFNYSGVCNFRPLFDLTTDCIAFHPSLTRWQVMSVQLKSSKTDIFRQGQSLTIASTLSTLCTVPAMQECFLLANPEPGPLFYFQSGHYLTCSTVSHLLRTAGLPHRSLKRAIAFL